MILPSLHLARQPFFSPLKALVYGQRTRRVNSRWDLIVSKGPLLGQFNQVNRLTWFYK